MLQEAESVRLDQQAIPVVKEVDGGGLREENDVGFS